ncbi:MAG: class I SAM-dependent methyltransferase [Rhizobiales bacterium]|nr:class I SAM-dependent methyltransferase [Hyphomicrobiales bacterium]
MTDNAFYREFEANFRGTREEIVGRLRVYLPFLRPFTEAAEGPGLVDLGCGRGEWLELAAENGMRAEGVDLDDGMLQDCFARGLSARNMDAIAFLRSLPDASRAVVSGFHIAEHLPFEVLQALIAEAHRVLQPGGLLILETPNAENLDVGTLAFHMDPTHNKPLPPGLLSFLPRYHGFARAKVLRLQEKKPLAAAETVRLIDVFRGVSPDYAVIAQKAGEAAFLAQFDALFAADYGLTLDTLSERFERGFQQQIRLIEEQLRELSDIQQRLAAVYESTSWRVTKPLRAASSIAADMRERAAGARSALGASARKTARRVAMLAAAQPLVREAGKRVLGRFPDAAARMRGFLLSSGGALSNQHFQHGLSASQLSPRARLLYRDLSERLGKNG